jgi:beta-mannosidase
MAETFGEWRRSGSPCAGGLVLWSRDLRPGAGWGLWDVDGAAKPAVHHLRRALAPVAVWLTDEGLAGIAVHVANDRPAPLAAELRLAAYRDRETKVAEAVRPLALGGHAAFTADAEALFGRFLDVNWTYRFGPPAVDLLVASLYRDGVLISQAFRQPLGPPTDRESADALTLTARRFVYGIRLPGADDDDFCLEPGSPRTLALSGPPPVALTALNLRDPLALG